MSSMAVKLVNVVSVRFLLDGKAVNSCVLLAAQAQGHQLQTIESFGEPAGRGWKPSRGLHPLQEAFVQSGAIQCGYCTPAQLLAAKELLDRNPNPTETEVRQALAGVLCRCTGYLKPVQAVLLAAKILQRRAPWSRSIWGRTILFSSST